MAKLTAQQFQEISDGFTKAKRVIESCETEKHKKVAIRYIYLLGRSWENIIPPYGSIKSIGKRKMIRDMENELLIVLANKKVREDVS